MRNKTLFLFIAAIMLSSCGGQQWRATQAEVVIDAHNRFSVRTPSGWMQLVSNTDSILMTRDGLSIQYIKVGVIGEEMLQTKIRVIARDKNKDVGVLSLLPSELAAIVISIFKSSKPNLKVVSNRPAILGENIPGFRLVLTYKTNSGLRIKRELYGYARGKKLVFIMYQSPVLSFYKRDLAVFKSLVASYKPLAR